MTFKKSINNIRRKVLRQITKRIGREYPDVHETLKGEIKRILICRPNHRLGNMLLITPLVQEVVEYFPNCEIDLFVKGFLGPVIFKNYENISNFIQLPKKPHKELIKYLKGWLKIRRESYDLVVNVISDSSSGRLSARLSNGKYKFFGDENVNAPMEYPDGKHNAKFPVYNLRSYLLTLGYKLNERPVPLLDLKLSAVELANGQILLGSLVQNLKRTICLYTYATGDKCYSKNWWDTLYTRLKLECTEYNIIEILPIENVSQLSFAAPAFYSKDIREMGSLIANAEIFIGADSGIMHLASSVHVPTIGFFAVTAKDSYAPCNDKSVAIETNNTKLDDWMREITNILGIKRHSHSVEFSR
ncbi:MAG TPA: glycosyltransferase family 9 protein [Chryseolinea sp.]|nr:glycosyltransferase family 9 protein [Chryseolinea sp.]